VIVGAAALFDSSHRVLVAQRPSDGSMPDVWEFPGGKQRIDENIRSTTCRELLEELGIRIGEHKLCPFDVVEHSYETFDLVFHLFTCSEWEGHLTPVVHNRLRWVPLRQLSLYPMPPADGPLVEKLVLAFGDT
jgi:mutator protein MutT